MQHAQYVYNCITHFSPQVCCHHSALLPYAASFVWATLSKNRGQVEYVWKLILHSAHQALFKIRCPVCRCPVCSFCLVERTHGLLVPMRTSQLEKQHCFGESTQKREGFQHALGPAHQSAQSLELRRHPKKGTIKAPVPCVFQGLSEVPCGFHYLFRSHSMPS